MKRSRSPHLIAFLAFLFIQTPGFSSDPPVHKESAPPPKPHAEEDPLNPHVEGEKTPPPKPAPPKPIPPAKPPAPKESKAPKPNPGHGSGHDSAPLGQAGLEGILGRLKEGNQRFAANMAQRPRQDPGRRAEVAKGQKPIAAIVACADSRVPPEVVFDQGLGDLFVVRNAGHVLEPSLIGSLEYAVEHLGVSVIVVLGHERCGAVDAACKKGEPEGHVGALVEAIQPAVEAARKKGGDLLTQAVAANVLRVTDEIRSSWPLLAPKVREGRILVTGGVYDLEDGRVAFFP